MYVVYQREEPLFVFFLDEKEQRRLCWNRVSLRSKCFHAVSMQFFYGGGLTGKFYPKQVPKNKVVTCGSLFYYAWVFKLHPSNMQSLKRKKGSVSRRVFIHYVCMDWFFQDTSQRKKKNLRKPCGDGRSFRVRWTRVSVILL